MLYSTKAASDGRVAGASVEFLGSIWTVVAGAEVEMAAIDSAACAGRPPKHARSGTARWIAFRGRRRASLSRTFAPGAGDDAGPSAAHTGPSPAISDHSQSANDRDATMIVTTWPHVTGLEPPGFPV
jgi:hypothetical protein